MPTCHPIVVHWYALFLCHYCWCTRVLTGTSRCVRWYNDLLVRWFPSKAVLNNLSVHVQLTYLVISLAHTKRHLLHLFPWLQATPQATPRKWLYPEWYSSAHALAVLPVSPFFYTANQAPSYHLVIGSLLVANVLEFITFFVLRYAFKGENRMKERNRVASLREAGVGIGNADATAFHNITDKENPNFVYVL